MRSEMQDESMDPFNTAGDDKSEEKKEDDGDKDQGAPGTPAPGAQGQKSEAGPFFSPVPPSRQRFS